MHQQLQGHLFFFQIYSLRYLVFSDGFSNEKNVPTTALRWFNNDTAYMYYVPLCSIFCGGTNAYINREKQSKFISWTLSPTVLCILDVFCWSTFKNVRPFIPFFPNFLVSKIYLLKLLIFCKFKEQWLSG